MKNLEMERMRVFITRLQQQVADLQTENNRLRVSLQPEDSPERDSPETPSVSNIIIDDVRVMP